MRFNPQPNVLFAKKTNLLTDINLYKPVRLSTRIRNLSLKKTPASTVNKLSKTLLGKKSTLKYIKSVTTASNYRRLLLSQKVQSRMFYGNIDRTLKPYKRFRRMGEWALPSEEHDPTVDVPFSVSPDAARAGTSMLTSFWEKHLPHILGVKGPRYSNILVKRTRWYGIKPTTLVKFRYNSRVRSYFRTVQLPSTQGSLTPLDDEDQVKLAFNSAQKARVLGNSSIHQLSQLTLSTSSVTSFLDVGFFRAGGCAVLTTNRHFILQAILRVKHLGLLALPQVTWAVEASSYLTLQRSLVSTDTFFNKSRRDNNLLAVPQLEATSRGEWFTRSVKGSIALKRRTRQQKKTYRYFFGAKRATPYVPSSSYVSTPYTSNIFHKYYTFIRMSRIQGRTQLRRPLFSHVFNVQQLYKRSLITISNDVDSLPLRKVMVSESPRFWNYFHGLGAMWDHQANDNFIESSIDNHVLVASSSRNNGALQSQLLGLFSRATQTSQGAISLSGYPLVTTNSPLVGHDRPTTASSFNLLLGSDRVSAFLSNDLLFKFLFWDMNTLRPSSSLFVSNSTLTSSLRNVSRYGFSARSPILLKTNLWPLSLFNYTIRRKVLKVVVNMRYLPRTTSYFYKTLVSFMEFYTGKKVYLKFNAFIENSLTYSDLARCYIWFSRVLGFQKILGHRIFVHESLRIFHIAIRFRDPTFLANWIKAMLYRMSFWKYRVLFRYIKYVLRTLFWSHFDDLDFKGVKLALRGKISVAGNARARSLLYSVGQTSHAEMNNRVLSHFTTVHSFTGVMGFRLTFYF